MFVVHSYPLAVVLCVITMLCWGSWANTRKLARKNWRFELFYWDYALGVLLLTLALGITLGSSGTEGRSFAADLAQASAAGVGSALLGGGIFNLANILLVAAIAVAGMVVVFAVGVFLSNFVWNTLAMKKPFVGTPVSFASYFQGDFRTHLTGILGGCIWGIGMSLNLIASGPAGFAISYGLGQGATMIAACWGVFIWKEFATAPAGTSKLLTAMFASFVSGLALIVLARTL